VQKHSVPLRAKHLVSVNRFVVRSGLPSQNDPAGVCTRNEFRPFFRPFGMNSILTLWRLQRPLWPQCANNTFEVFIQSFADIAIYTTHDLLFLTIAPLSGNIRIREQGSCHADEIGLTRRDRAFG